MGLLLVVNFLVFNFWDDIYSFKKRVLDAESEV